MLKPEDILEQLKPCSYRYNDKIDGLGDKIQFGLIAQDLLQAFGDDFDFVREKEGYYSVNYIQFIPILIKVVQEQNERIKRLEDKLGKTNERNDL